MSIGFNSKVQCTGGLYDVQTEDRGAARPFIDTLVVLSGQVLHRRSVSYSDLLASGAADQTVLRGRAERQHREILEALRSGSLPLQDAVSAASTAIQVKLLNATGWLVKGKVTLEIEVLTRAGGEAVSDAEVEARIEGTGDALARFLGKSDARGRLRLEFALPPLTDSGPVALVISVRAGSAQDQLRYNLKATPTAPLPPAR
jgi:hypothetical protein